MHYKYHIILIIIIFLFITQIDITNGLEKNTIHFQNLSSQKFLTFVNDKNIGSKITKICTTDFCDFIRGNNITQSFTIFVDKYEEYLTQKTNEETAHSTIIKGFPITSINVLD